MTTGGASGSIREQLRQNGWALPPTCPLCRHLAAALSAVAALLDALIHVTDLLARAGALLTDLRAFAAGMLVVLGANQHEVRRGPADLGTSHHDPEMTGLDVLAASFKAVVHRLAE